MRLTAKEAHAMADAQEYAERKVQAMEMGEQFHIRAVADLNTQLGDYYSMLCAVLDAAYLDNNVCGLIKIDSHSLMMTKGGQRFLRALEAKQT